MIAALTGRIDAIGADHAVIDVGGVGYLVFASSRTLGALPAPGGQAKLLVETHVREDHIHLYGFAGTGERDWFRLLTTVQGVGAKTALNILSALDPDRLAAAVAAQDKAALTVADGVGQKLALRLVTELKDKVAHIALGLAPKGAPASAPRGGTAADDAVSALVNLGMGRAEAFAAVARAQSALGDKATADVLIRAGLKELAA